MTTSPTSPSTTNPITTAPCGAADDGTHEAVDLPADGYAPWYNAANGLIGTGEAWRTLKIAGIDDLKFTAGFSDPREGEKGRILTQPVRIGRECVDHDNGLFLAAVRRDAKLPLVADRHARRVGQRGVVGAEPRGPRADRAGGLACR